MYKYLDKCQKMYLNFIYKVIYDMLCDVNNLCKKMFYL